MFLVSFILYRTHCLFSLETKRCELLDNVPLQSPALPRCEVQNITCHVNRLVSKNAGTPSSRTFQCKNEGNEVFVPFSFVKNQFETYGDFVATDGGDSEFEISHSYSKIYSPRTQYDPGGQYMHFGHFDVESRSRVKCISAGEGT